MNVKVENWRQALSIPRTGVVSDTGLNLPDNLTQEQWRSAGLEIARLRGATQWWIGDWWAYAEHKYGERKAIVESEEWDGPAFQTCANAAQICKVFTTSRRREVLSFSHHVEVASLPQNWQDALLDEAEDGDEDGRIMPVSRLRQRVKEVKGFLAQGWTPDQLDRQAIAEQGLPVVASMQTGDDGLEVDRALLAWADANDRLVRIDRQSDWGNPFVVDKDGTRDEVIENYRWYIDHKPSLIAKIPSLSGKVLSCWCHPLPCHGQILCELALAEVIKKGSP